jgi:HEAT repeat protein
MGDSESFVRTEALHAVERFDIELARPYLVRALMRHEDKSVRLQSAELLAADGDPISIGALVDAFGDEEPIGGFAVNAIRALESDRAIVLLIAALDHEDYGVQVAAIHALVDIKTPLATEPMIDLLDSEVPDVTLAATQGLRALSEHLDRTKWVILARRADTRFERARALKVLGILGGEDVSLILLNALDDPDVLVRGAAVTGIASLKELRAIPKLEEMKKHEANGRIIALVRITLTNLQRLREKAKSAS